MPRGRKKGTRKKKEVASKVKGAEEYSKGCSVGSAEKKLLGLASSEPWKDGFHQGIESNDFAIELEYGKHLKDLVVQTKPDVVVEVGTGEGYSASWILLGLEQNKKGKLYTIDNNPSVDYSCVWKKIGLDDKRMVKLSGRLEENLKDIPDGVGLVLLDGDHQIDVIARDVEHIDSKLSKKAIVCVHDVNYCREMGNLLDDFFLGNDIPELRHCGVKAQKKGIWDYKEISNACGMGIAQKRK